MINEEQIKLNNIYCKQLEDINKNKPFQEQKNIVYELITKGYDKIDSHHDFWQRACEKLNEIYINEQENTKNYWSGNIEIIGNVHDCLKILNLLIGYDVGPTTIHVKNIPKSLVKDLDNNKNILFMAEDFEDDS